MCNRSLSMAMLNNQRVHVLNSTKQNAGPAVVFEQRHERTGLPQVRPKVEERLLTQPEIAVA